MRAHDRGKDEQDHRALAAISVGARKSVTKVVYRDRTPTIDATARRLD